MPACSYWIYYGAILLNFDGMIQIGHALACPYRTLLKLLPLIFLPAYSNSV